MQIEGGGPSVQIAEGRFADFDAFAEAVSGWCVDFRQIDAGEAPVELIQLEAPGVLLSRARFTRAYDQQGEGPSAMRTIALLDGAGADVVWCGQPFVEDEFAVFPETGGFEATSRPGFGCWTLSFSDDLLAQRTVELGRPELFGHLMKPGVRPGKPAALRRLRATLDELGAGPLGSASDVLLEGSIREILDGVLGLCTPTAGEMAPPPGRLRDRAFRRARAYVLDCGAEQCTVTGMCEASGASWRTLDYAFRERLGVTPQAYLKAVRLDAFRKSLLVAEDGARIIDVATEHGFWHMGQLAADYRAQFGELPSRTKSRSLMVAGT